MITCLIFSDTSWINICTLVIGIFVSEDTFGFCFHLPVRTVPGAGACEGGAEVAGDRPGLLGPQPPWQRLGTVLGVPGQPPADHSTPARFTV